MRMLATLVSLLTLATNAMAAVRHVPADYHSIQAALNASTLGDEVLVAPGTYAEHIVFGAAQDGVKLHSEAGSATTIIDGMSSGSAVFLQHVGSGTEVRGFTIQNGGPDSTNVVNSGGGIAIWNGSPTIAGNVIRGSHSDFGGGLWVAYSSSSITGNEIYNNEASDNGGGAYITDSSVLFENNTVHDNSSNTIGGGVGGLLISQCPAGMFLNNQILFNQGTAGGGFLFLGNSSVTLQGNSIRSNTSNTVGGGLVIERSAPTIENNQIVGNVGLHGGGGLYYYSANGALRNNLLQDNDAPSGDGGGVIVDGGSSPSLIGNQILRNHCAGHGGGVVATGASHPAVTSNTISLNQCGLGGGNVYVGTGSSAMIARNIVSHSPGSGIETGDATATANLSCNDVWGNTTGNYVSLADATGTDNNVSVDPAFCDLPSLDVHLHLGSPCSAAKSPVACGLVGALDVNCSGPVRTEALTWGAVRARYR